MRCLFPPRRQHNRAAELENPYRSARRMFTTIHGGDAHVDHTFAELHSRSDDVAQPRPRSGLHGSWSGDARTRVWVPALDVVEKRDEYLVIAELPGVTQSQVELGF